MSTAAPAKSTKPGTIDVPRPMGKCAVCGQVIAPGEKCFAAIRETESGIERLDISSECWPNFDKQNLLAFWQMVMPQAEEKKKLFVDDEVLCTLFERLNDTTEPVKIHFRFVLGLILMRKRLVVYESAKKEHDHDVWIVRMKGKDELLTLADPKLTEQQVADVSQQLGQILHEEL